MHKPTPPKTLNPVSEQAARHVATALRLIEDRRYTEAALKLAKALREDPSHPQIHRALCRLHWRAGNVERARTHAVRALEGNPDNAATQYILGRCEAMSATGDDRYQSEARGDLSAAILHYRTALLCSDRNRNPDNVALIHYYLGEALTGAGYLDAALKQYSRFDRAVTGRDPADVNDSELATLLHSTNGSAREARSRTLDKLGRFAEAAAELAPLIAQLPDDVRHRDRKLQLLYATLLLKAGQLDEALLNARAIGSDDEDVLTLLLNIHKQAGDPAGALTDLRNRLAVASATSGGHYRVVLTIADTLVRLGRSNEAREELAAYLDRDPEALGVRERLISLLVAAEAWTDTLQVFADGVQRNPERFEELEKLILPLASNTNALAVLLNADSPDEPATYVYARGVLAAAATQRANCAHCLDQAASLLEQSRAQIPTFLPARVALAKVYLRLYRYDDAIEVAGRAEQNVPEDARLELVLGQAYERLDDVRQAKLHLRAAVQLDRRDTHAMYALAELYGRLGDTPAAQRQIRLLFERDPAHVPAREMLARIYLNEGKLDAATEQLEELRRHSVSEMTRARSEALLDLVHTRDTDAHRRALLKALHDGPADAATWLAVADTYGEFEQADARTAYRNALTIDQENEEATLGLIFAEQRLLEYERAIDLFEVLLPRRPNRHAWRLGWSGRGWRFGLLELYLIVGDYETALAMARDQVVRGDLDEVTRSRYRLGILHALRRLDLGPEVVRLLQSWAAGPRIDVTATAQRVVVSSEDVWSVRLAHEYVRQGQVDRAVELVESLYGSRTWDLQRWLGDVVEVLSQAGRHDRAGQRLLDRLREDPDDDNAVASLAASSVKAQRPLDGLELVRNNLLRTRDRQRFQDLAVTLLDSAERGDEAVALIETLLGEVVGAMRAAREPPVRRPVEPSQPTRGVWWPNEPLSRRQLEERLVSLRVRLAGQLTASQEYRAAQRQLDDWLERANNPGSRFVYLLALASCYRQQGNEAEAGNRLELALSLRPDIVGLNNDVAYGWIDRGIRLKRAERMIRYALSRRPRQMAYLDTFGWLLYKKGEFLQARKWLERGRHARTRKDPVVLDHLGDTCWRLGKRSEAIEYWTEALAAATETREEAGDASAAVSADERRVIDTAQGKIDAGLGNRVPQTASLAESAGEKNEENVETPKLGN